MATYYVVDKDKDPLEPGEVNAGGTIDVNAGDIFVIDPSVSDDIKFVSSTGSLTDFEIRIDESNSSKFDIQIKDELKVDIHIADNVDIGDVEFEAEKSNSTNLVAGDNVSIREFDGSTSGSDTLTFGDNFTADELDTKGGDDVITIGDGANIHNIETDEGGDNGEDSVTIADGANIHEIKTGAGDDSVTIGDDFTGNKIETKDGDDDVTIGDGATLKDLKTGKGDDTVEVGDDYSGKKIDTNDGDDHVTIGSNAEVKKLNGGNGDDHLTTKTEFPDAKAFETVVCFVRGTSIRTQRGEVKIEDLREGDKVRTLDRGLQPIRWIGSSIVRGHGNLAPIRIKKGAMGNRRDLWVSPQHRMLVGSWRSELYFGEEQVLTPAKFLVDGDNICIEEVDEVEYFHMLFDQHEIVFAEGAPSESFHPGVVGLGSMSDETRNEIFEIFPSLRDEIDVWGPAARPSLKAFEGSLLVKERPVPAVCA